MKTFLMVAAVVTSLGAAAGLAQAGDEEVVAHRKMVIGTAGKAAVSLLHILQGKIDDREHFARIARIHAEAAAMAEDAFSVDTRGFDEKTAAKDEIWENWDDFAARLRAYVADAEKMAEIAESGDMAAAGKQIEEVLGNCKGCHDNYKE